MKSSNWVLAITVCLMASCNSSTSPKIDAGKPAVTDSAVVSARPGGNAPADAALILAKRQVPVLCYHHIRYPKPGQSETMKSYSVSPVQFAEQMKALKDSGFETVLPNQLYDYLVLGTPLPSKPVMLTFDDTDEEQFTIGAPEMKKYGFKGVFFIMTVSINRPRYMSKEQIRQLSEDGHAVESHTWDHQMFTKYKGEDWQKQLIQPMNKVEEITGRPARYFAYPFGIWNREGIPELKKAGYKMAFALSGKRDSTEPLYTIRRMIVPGTWSAPGMIRAMNKTFKL